MLFVPERPLAQRSRLYPRSHVSVRSPSKLYFYPWRAADAASQPVIGACGSTPNPLTERHAPRPPFSNLVSNMEMHVPCRKALPKRRRSRRRG